MSCTSKMMASPCSWKQLQACISAVLQPWVPHHSSHVICLLKSNTAYACALVVNLTEACISCPLLNQAMAPIVAACPMHMTRGPSTLTQHCGCGHGFELNLSTHSWGLCASPVQQSLLLVHGAAVTTASLLFNFAGHRVDTVTVCWSARAHGRDLHLRCMDSPAYSKSAFAASLQGVATQLPLMLRLLSRLCSAVLSALT